MKNILSLLISLVLCIISYGQEDIGIISQMGSTTSGGTGGGTGGNPPVTGWATECPVCPNASVVSNGDEYTPTSSADLTNVSNAGRTAIISNSFDITGAILAANQIIVPSGGILTGTGINLNGASFVINDQQAFATSVTFTSRYTGCLRPETFGAGNASNDQPALVTVLTQCDYISNSAGATYTITSASRTIKWIGNNSKIEVLASAEGSNLYILKFNTNRPEICNLELDGNDIGDLGIEINGSDFYLEDVWIHNLYRENGSPSYGIWQKNWDVDTCRDTRIYNCKINNISSLDDGIIGNGDGSTRAILISIVDMVNTSLQSSTVWEIRDSEIHDIIDEGDGIHFQGTSAASSQEHDVLWVIDNCNFYDNTRRDIKAQTSGLHITNSFFGKISPQNPNYQSAPAGSVGASLLDDNAPGSNQVNVYIGYNTFYYRSPSDPPAGPGDFSLAITRSENAIVEYNTFNKPITWAANNILLGRYNHNLIIRENNFTNGGIAFSSGMSASSPSIKVFNNTFNTNNFGGGYQHATFINPGYTNPNIDGLNIYDNTINIDFSGSNTNRWVGILGTRSGDSTTWDNITINNNDITFTGANKANKPFINISGNFGSTNTISNHIVTGITATGAFQITGIKNFTNTSNTDENSNLLTVQ